MSESTPINIQAFQPFDGGMGKRLSVSSTSSRGQIPGTQAVDEGLRILVTNGGSVSAFIRLGQETVAATTDCIEILPGTSVLLSPASTRPSALWLAAICEAGTTKIQVTAGKGT